MITLSDFNMVVPVAAQPTIRELIDKFSCFPESQRLLVRFRIAGMPTRFMIEVPLDDPRGTLLMAVVAPSSAVRVTTTYSPKLARSLEKYWQRPDAIRPDYTDPFAGCGVLTVKSAEPEIGLDERFGLQFHPLFNAGAAMGRYNNLPPYGLVCRCTSGAQPKTSEGCIAIGRETVVAKLGGFNEADVLYSVPSVDGSLYDTCTPRWIIQNYGEALFRASCKKLGYSNRNLTILQASNVLNVIEPSEFNS